MKDEEIGLLIKKEKEAIKNSQKEISRLQNELKKNKNIDEIIENIPLIDPNGRVVAFALKYKSGMMLLYATINMQKIFTTI